MHVYYHGRPPWCISLYHGAPMLCCDEISLSRSGGAGQVEQVSSSRYLLKQSVCDVTLMSSKRTDWLTRFLPTYLGGGAGGAGTCSNSLSVDVTVMSSKRTDWLTGGHSQMEQVRWSR